jgi:NhaA family Na+:H+ antiporter
MAVPALIYAALNHADPATSRGWAVPMATDIAFSLAVLRALGPLAGRSLRVFLTALAILDDLGAILVIALFYAHDVAPLMLAAAAAVWLALLGLNRAGVRALWPYLAGGLALWLLVAESGVQATVAGVALAFVVPTGQWVQGQSATRRLEHGLAGLVALVVVPIFGLANAGLDLRNMSPAILLTPAPLGVVLGLFLGKQIGVFGATMAGRRLGLLHLPSHMSIGELAGGAVLCGIGFTMSLFIGHLTFVDTSLNDPVKFAVLAASFLSAFCGMAVLAAVHRRRGRKLYAAESSGS